MHDSTDGPSGTVVEAVPDEPVPAAEDAAGAGSSPVSPPTLARDLGRALLCALVVAGCVGTPASALLVAPFAPLLVALRLLRDRRGVRRFLVLVGVLSAAAGGAASVELEGGDRALVAVIGVVAGVGLAALLGMAHARAAGPDPASANPEPWAEPRLSHGLAPVVAAWAALMAVVVALAVPAVTSLRALEQAQVRDAYGIYDRQCEPGGALGSDSAVCDRIADQREAALDIVEDRAPELLGMVAALVVVGSAAAAHLLVLWRARRTGGRVRTRWRLRDLEMHWLTAYVGALGAGSWMAGDAVGGSVGDVLRGGGVALGVGAALLLAGQGLGLVAWALVRRHAPRWYRIVLSVGALILWTFALPTLVVLGMVDMWLRPRRRALAADAGAAPG